MNPKLESSEFYHNRFRNFSTMIIIPIFVFLLIIVGASFFVKKEIVIKGQGSIEPVTKVITIQTPVNSAITKNYLEEGKIVTKGQKLLVFDNRVIKNKSKFLVNQQASQLSQQEALRLLEQSITQNQDLFPQDDQYGYHESLKSYLAQRAVYENQRNIIQSKATYEKKQRGASDKSFDSSGYDINEINDKLVDLQAEQLQIVKQKLSQLALSQQNLGAKITATREQEENYVVTAPKAGVLHLVNEAQNHNKYVGSGTTMAQIYPKISEEPHVKVVTYISAADVATVKNGQSLRFKVSRNTTKRLILVGKITKVGTAPVEVNKQVVYKVEALVKVDPNQKIYLKYGLIGQANVITGRVQWIDYLKSQIMEK